MESPLVQQATRLAWFGLVPFIVTAVLGAFHVYPDFLLQVFLIYSAVILSFLGGIHWALAMTENLPRPQGALLICMLPSIVAWASVSFLNEKVALLVLAAVYLLWLNYDIKMVNQTWYERFRKPITFVVAGTHLIWFVVVATAARTL
ncbi:MULTISPECIES: DUF3429 domain-containing protein [Gammaproteobacteria]|uniref:DUF3429 domain-containing protein n=1 Tax=Gammaproteobacteria TaxID=1236 RepID=UPI000DD00757|nr:MULTISPECIES: DUF3429 domain-containing protein [Gammaproteobacteria]RTE87731.1 DUF3429 domain-containing protein [Aliidiomarina sp. B3213]TCZ92487.1 DUF3429 domain-containing protein [Lysobacter sp. N42]